MVADTLARWERPGAALLLAWFAARALYFAASTPYAIPPDESAHYRVSRIFAEVAFVPPDSERTIRLGVVSRQPYLYYLAAGKLLALAPAPEAGLRLLRAANAALAVLTLAVVWRCVRRQTRDPAARLLCLVMASHTLMFTLLAGSVSYDNLANLLAALAFACLLAFLQERRPAALVALAACLLAGALTKRSLLPLVPLFGGAALWHARRDLRAAGVALAAWARRPGPAGAALLAAALVLFLLSAALYGENLVRFGRPLPRCEQALDAALCERHGPSRREAILSAYRAGELTYTAAVARMGRDGRGLHFLERTRARERGEPVRSRLAYAPIWGEEMLRRLFGFMGHRSALKSRAELVPYLLVLGLGALRFAARWRPGRDPGFGGTAAVLVLAYAALLMEGVNYASYLRTNSVLLGIQGRYLLPLLAPGSGLVARGLTEGLGPRLRVAVLALVTLLFVLGDLPWFLLNRPEPWVARLPLPE